MNRASVVAALSFILCASAPRAHSQAQNAPPLRTSWQVVTAQGTQLAVMLNLTALQPVAGPGFQMHPVLSVRCKENQLAVFVATSWVLASDDNMTSPVSLTWGASPVVTTRWTRSTDYTAVFAPDPVFLLRQLLTTPDLRFGIHPADGDPVEIGFDARGLDRHLWAIQTSCPFVMSEQLATLDSAGSPTPGDSSPVFEEGKVEQPPQVVSGPPLVYPVMLRNAGVTGRVVLSLIVDTTGRAEPRSITVLQSPHTGFNAAATDWALGARFRPARLHGHAVRTLVRLPIDFKIRWR